MRSRAMSRTWIEVDLDILVNNYRIARSKIKESTGFIAVVKANAYGNGAPVVAAALENEPGLYAFAVASFDEAEELRLRGIRKPILILGYTAPHLAADLARLDLTTAIVSGEYGRALDRYARDAGCKVKGHIKVDSGMSRLGIMNHGPDQLEAAIAEAEEILACQRLEIDAAFTHFATAGWQDTSFTEQQFNNFKALLDALEARGHKLPRSHCCNSGAVAFHPRCELSTVRSGSLLYGYQPDGKRPVEGLRMPTQLKSSVGQVKDLRPGDKVGYNLTYECTQPMTIAVIPIGYADGLPYSFSNKGRVLINGQWAPVVGTICMDQMMVDITGIEGVRPGQTITIFGEDNDVITNLFEQSLYVGAMPAQFATNITPRVPRVYLRGGMAVSSDSLV
ncbi:MAG: alanine racemase [Clostridia bacterium]|nr:alanine racemase [Clostridia bacterium]